MQRYRYKHGDHPLEGYTIQRAAGRGGFGEVYYALSDSGREVAIKAVQNYEQIELRGITQCMNLKSPHLVTIFDVKYNDRGQPFVIMEYVSGPSLRTLLAESPGGLGKQKAAFFLREIAKGLAYLHECGIVHRDLKPGNIFYENGYVKVGDYGLTKAIGATRHSGHTITVGTVHYMAPEIGAGKYNFGIDIYALGVLLYEMLTGKVPFAGESPAEILMKHMSAEPELKNIEEPFAHVIKKALAKDPDERYQSVQEMVEDLFGEENIRNSVSHFSPEELSIVAQKVAEKAKIGEKAQKPKTVAPAHGNANEGFSETAQNVFGRVDAMGRAIADQVDSKVDYILGAKKARIPGVTYPIKKSQRFLLIIVLYMFISGGASFLEGSRGTEFFDTAQAVVILMTVFGGTILLLRSLNFLNIKSQYQWFERVFISGITALSTALFSIILFKIFFNTFLDITHFKALFLSLFLPTIFIDWRRMSLPDRQKRLSLGSALWAGLLGAIAGQIFLHTPIIIGAVMAGTSLAVQAISAFGQEEQNISTKQKSGKQQTQFQSGLVSGVVPRSVRMLFLVGSFITLGIGLFLLILAGVGNFNSDEFSFAIAMGVDSLILSVFFFIGFCRSRINGWYRYIIKPAILLICVLSIVTSGIFIGTLNRSSGQEEGEFAAALFFIIFPALAFILVALIPAKAIVGDAPKPSSAKVLREHAHIPSLQVESGVSVFKRFWALLLSAGGFFGVFGLQRFYVGKIGTGILWFFTGGLFLVGQIIDVIMILTGNFKDCYDLPLLIWHEKDELGERAHFVQAPVPEYRAAVHQEQPVQEIPPARAVEAQKHPASDKPTTVIISEPFHPFAFLFSGLGFILAFIAVIVGFILGFRIPFFVAAGWPSWELTGALEDLFGFPTWPGLVLNLGKVIFIILMLFSAGFMVIGRRHLGIKHIIRAVAGICIMLFAFQEMIFNCVSNAFFENVQVLLNLGQIGPAFERFFSGWHEGEVIAGVVLILVSIVILAWPAKNQTLLTASQIQGVS